MWMKDDKQSNKGKRNTTKRKKMKQVLRIETIIDEKFESELEKNERPLEMGECENMCIGKSNKRGYYFLMPIVMDSTSWLTITICIGLEKFKRSFQDVKIQDTINQMWDLFDGTFIFILMNLQTMIM